MCVCLLLVTQPLTKTVVRCCVEQKTTLNTWIKWTKTRVVGELLMAPDVKPQVPGKLRDAFSDVANKFMAWRKEQCDELMKPLNAAKDAVKAELAKVDQMKEDADAKVEETQAATTEAEAALRTGKAVEARDQATGCLVEAMIRVAADLEQGLEDLARLEQAIKQHKLKPRAPSVVVLFRDNLKLTLGDIFGGILSRTVEKEEDVGASGRKQGQGGHTAPESHHFFPRSMASSFSKMRPVSTSSMSNLTASGKQATLV